MKVASVASRGRLLPWRELMELMKKGQQRWELELLHKATLRQIEQNAPLAHHLSQQPHGVEGVSLEFQPIVAGSDWDVREQRFQSVKPLRFKAGSGVVVENNHFRVRAMSMMPSDLCAQVARNNHASRFANDVVYSVNVRCAAAPIAASDYKVLRLQIAGELKTPAQKMLSGDFVPQRGRSGEGRSFDGGHDTPHLLLVNSPKVHWACFQTCQDNGLDQLLFVRRHHGYACCRSVV
jgi:hypothetical protein